MADSREQRRWMILPKNAAYPNFNEVHREDDWCAKAGCVPVGDECVKAGKVEFSPGAAEGPTPRCAECGFTEDVIAHRPLSPETPIKSGSFYHPFVGPAPQASREEIIFQTAQMIAAHETSYYQRSDAMWVWECGCGHGRRVYGARADCLLQTRLHWAEVIQDSKWGWRAGAKEAVG